MVFSECLMVVVSETTNHLHVFGLDRNTLTMESKQLGVTEQRNEKVFRRFLESSNGRSLEPKIRVWPEVLCNLTHKPRESFSRDDEIS